MIKTKKRKRSSRMHGRKMGTHGYGSRKKHKKSGHHGGGGMSGSGKRADKKKTLVTKLYGHGYFGKQGVTSKKVHKDKDRKINLSEIETSLERYGKKSGDKWNIELKKYKILAGGLGDGMKNYKVKNKLIITAKTASKSAIEEVKKAGGEIIFPQKSNE